MVERRMIKLAGYSYPSNRACFICKHVMDGSPILGMAHDHEGDLQLVCGIEGHPSDDWHVVGVGHIDHKKEVLDELPTVHVGFAAERNDINSPWRIVPIPVEN
jgi:hypothetical protein